MKKLVSVFAVCVLCLGCGETPLTEFKSPDGKFTVLFPGTPKTSEQTGKAGVKVKSFECASSSGSFLINFYDSPVPIANDPALHDKFTPLEAQGLVTGLGGTMGPTNVVKLQDKYQGVEYSSDVTKPRTGKLRGRTFIVDQRVYNLIVVGKEGTVNSELATRFFDSFKANP